MVTLDLLDREEPQERGARRRWVHGIRRHQNDTRAAHPQADRRKPLGGSRVESEDEDEDERERAGSVKGVRPRRLMRPTSAASICVPCSSPPKLSLPRSSPARSARAVAVGIGRETPKVLSLTQHNMKLRGDAARG